jgi:ubiquinone/menaquinone biosynthesis C-methylase UbiE
MGERHYLPAAGHDWFLPLYDPIIRVFGFRSALLPLVAQAELRPSHTVLDVGCGTGTLAVEIVRRVPGIRMTALDPDPKALAIARRKAGRDAVAIRFDEGFGDALPYPDASFDRVFSSMMFHHIPREDRTKVLSEIRRVLKTGGRLEFLDFSGGSHNFLAQLFHPHQHSPAAEDRLLKRMAEAGFASARHTGDGRTIFGRLAFYQASA